MVGAALPRSSSSCPPRCPLSDVRLCVLGAELVLTDPKGGVSAAAVAEAERIASSERPGAIIASQFTNLLNPAARISYHTGEEIWADTESGRKTVAGVGTGGTISASKQRVLKDKNLNVRIVAVQPAESPLLTGEPSPARHPGPAPNLVPDTFDADLIDEVVSVEHATVPKACRAAAEEPARGSHRRSPGRNCGRAARLRAGRQAARSHSCPATPRALPDSLFMV